MNEETLLHLWKDILDLPDISPDDDFFLCGGNSLTAIELLIRIQREYHINLPPDTIYRYPTIKGQVALLRKKAGTAKEYHTLISPLREGGDLPPLFCIHPLGGWMDHYLKILTAIDKNRPVFGIRGRGLATGETLPKTVEETAREQVEALRTVQKTGPYHLLGFSNGGIIAYRNGVPAAGARGERGLSGSHRCISAGNGGQVHQDPGSNAVSRAYTGEDPRLF